MTRLVLLLLVLIAPIAVVAHDDFPTEDIIQKLLSKNHYSKVDIYEKDKTKISTVYLKNHEKAYLVPVAIPGTRNDTFQTALVRPTIGEARVLEGTIIKRVDAIYDLDNDKVYELVVSNIDSGGGTEIGKRAIVQMDNWNPVILHERPFETNEGEWEKKDARYHSEQYLWEFVDLNGDGVLDLKETAFIDIGRNKLPPIPKTTVKEYLYIKGKFIPRELKTK